MRGRAIAVGVIVVALGASATPAAAQAPDSLAVPADTLFKAAATTYTSYDTWYDRDISSGTWNQALTYSRATRTLALSATGNYSTVDYAAAQGNGSGNGGFDGQLAYRATPAWTINLIGHFNKVASHDPRSQATVRGNRLNGNMSYVLRPVKQLVVNATLSSELQQNHTLNLRSFEVNQMKQFPVLGAAGETLRVDTLYVANQRDSTFMSGREDGASVAATWRPKTWLNATAQANGTRVQPVTKSYLRDFGQDPDSIPGEHVGYTRDESPNSSENYQSRLNFSGIPRTLAWLSAGTTDRTQQYFDKNLRGQEHMARNQRMATFHVEHAPIPGGQIMVEAYLDRAASAYALRTSGSSLVSGRTIKSSASYAPTPRTRFGGEFDVDYHKSEWQVVQNGLTLFRFLQLNGAHRTSPRLALDAVATVSLLSFRYVNAVADRDNLKTYFNGGGTYQVSPRCLTQVHFSRNEAHAIGIAPSSSGDNNVQTSYQMNASLQLTSGSSFRISQNYVLNANYQIYDAPAAESRNTLSRIRRIDTVAWDSLFSFATIQFAHNFLFQDRGTYTRPDAQHPREYNVASETYYQILGVSAAVKPMAGIQVVVTQSLQNAVTNFLATRARAVENRWNLEVGAQVDRPLGGTGTLTGSVRRIGAYTERVNPEDSLNDVGYWIANITLHKEFR